MDRMIILVGLNDDQIERVREAVGTRQTRYQIVRTQKEALDAVESIEPSVVIVAEKLPDGNGFDVCEQIKQVRYLNHVGVLIITESTETYDHSRSVLAGVDNFFEDHASLDLISDRVLEVADQKEALMPLEKRGSEEVADQAQTDDLYMQEANQYSPSDEEAKKPFLDYGGRAVTADVEGSGQEKSEIYHGFDGNEEAKADDLENDPSVYHSLKANHDTATNKGDDFDPLASFFNDDEEKETGGVSHGLPADAESKNFLNRKHTKPEQAVVLNPQLHGNIATLGPQIAETLTRNIEDWLDTMMGRKVDDSIREQVRQVIHPLIIKAVDSAIRGVID